MVLYLFGDRVRKDDMSERLGPQVGARVAPQVRRTAFRTGGGSVIACEHRLSNRIDLIDGARALGFLSPRSNDVTARPTDEYREAANALKLVSPRGGDVDFETTTSGRAHLDGMVDRVRHAIEQCE